MSENSTPEERTEMTKEGRRGKLRREGQHHNSTEVVKTASLFSGFIALWILWSWFYRDFLYTFEKSFELIERREPLTINDLVQGAEGLLWMFGIDLFILSLIIAVVASASMFLQTKFNMKDKLIKVKWDFLNPITGIKRIVSISGLMNVVRDVAKLCIILPIGYFALKEYAPAMIQLIHMSVSQVLEFMAEAMFDLFLQIMYVLIVLAIIDFFWTKHQWLKQNKMTKDEVKDERKAMEGDEKTKRQIQAKGLQRIMQRIQESVPQADVVITNPTHYAVALKYDRENMAAPTVVAKGKGFLAQRIKQIARDSSVPVLERKALARALYASVEIGNEVPRDLFKAVARVLAYVYKLKNPHRYRAQQSQGSN